MTWRMCVVCHVAWTIAGDGVACWFCGTEDHVVSSHYPVGSRIHIEPDEFIYPGEATAAGIGVKVA